nr:hypothetical protein [Rickettsia endosymbiont of Ceutorhynchus assimilis]
MDGSIKAAVCHSRCSLCHSRAGGNPEKYFLSHPEFISGYFSRDAETSSA